MDPKLPPDYKNRTGLLKVSFISGLIFLLAVLIVYFVVQYSLGKKSEHALDFVYQMASVDNSFFDTVSTAATGGFDSLVEAKNALLENKTAFIEADLERMELRLFQSGELKETLPIVSKGRDGSSWETPVGYYKILEKEANHFSSIGKVWMPWSMRFYGNFFIHGWPYYENGSPVPDSYSGGCIRLKTADAEKVYAFVDKNTPLLVSDLDSAFVVTKTLAVKAKAFTPPPSLTAKSAMIADTKSGEILLNSGSDGVLPIASLTKLMSAVVASELIYLERAVYISNAMLGDSVQSYPFRAGERYAAYELLYPLLMQSSNGAARALAGFMGEAVFVSEMNRKADSLQMSETTFVDPAGIGEGNVSTLKDLAKLLRYIESKRRFLFDITRGEEYPYFGSTPLSQIQNYNEFALAENLIGMKNGDTTLARKTMLTLWRMKDSSGFERSIVVGVLGSENAVSDTSALLDWTKNNFDLQ